MAILPIDGLGHHMVSSNKKALLVKHDRILYEDNSVAEMIIWELPKRTTERPHGYKYRLNYSLVDGTTILRYDNKLGKGDHRHIRNMIVPYKFESVDKLIDDFQSAVKLFRERR